MNSSCTTMPWNFGSAPRVKHESMDEDRNNDSGINSGSEFHSSSPGSDSQDVPHPYLGLGQSTSRYFHHHNPLTASRVNMPPYHPQNYSQPLTPPNSEPSLVSPKSEKEEKDSDATLTPCNSPNRLRGESSTSLTSASPSGDNEGSNDAFEGEFERTPKANSHGKVKTMKCKQCEYVALTKEEFWKHAATHIKEEKRLTCPKCPFITEYKHHLEYHLRNHTGSKPFKCEQCAYSCVNKSMLNSHMKSHSNVYQYHCSDCNYATKYCHSLKLHLRKYKHTPGRVLNMDGSVNPLPIIDVYGTRRGPKSKPVSGTSPSSSSMGGNGGENRLPSLNPQDVFPAFALNHFHQFQFPYPFLNGLPQPNPDILRNFQQLVMQERLALAAAQNNKNEDDEDGSNAMEQSSNGAQEVLDLSKPDDNGVNAKKEGSRRKGPAFKLDNFAVVNDDSDEGTDEDSEDADKDEVPKKAESNNNNAEPNTCQYCDITFGDTVIYTIHMGYHGFNNPYTCNMCGVECADKVSFFLHIARVSHS